MKKHGPHRLKITVIDPGPAGVVTLNLSRVIGRKVGTIIDTNGAGPTYEIPKSLGKQLSAIPGLIWKSPWTRVDRRSLTIEIAESADRTDTLTDVVLVITQHFGLNPSQMEVSRNIYSKK